MSRPIPNNGRGFRAAALLLLMAAELSGAQVPGSAEPETTGDAATRPNVLIIVADDLGAADLGYFGGEIETPTIDRLANSGVILTQFYASPSCSPTRAMLLTGVDHHRVGLGNMAEALLIYDQLEGKAGYEGYLNFRAATLPELMQAGGYHTYMAGKWHLGHTEDRSPRARGFDQSFALLDGAAGHFDQSGYSPLLQRASYRENGDLIDLPKDFYSTHTYTDKILSQIESNRGDGKPWFAYVAYTAPHYPLHAPRELIAKYEDRYTHGYAAVHRQRLERMVQLGYLTGEQAAQLQPPDDEWAALNAAEQAEEARAMALYAAMVDDLDRQVGRIIDELKAAGEYERTIVWFMSDNGPESTKVHKHPFLIPWIEENFDNSAENMGSVGSYVAYGEHWAKISALPWRGTKSSTFEGGIRVPSFVHFPESFPAGTRSDALATVMDVMPTVLAAAGIPHPAGRPNAEFLEMQGKSMVPLLRGESDVVHSGTDVIGWELSAAKALRRGTWKLVSANPSFENPEWQLYDLAADPFERDDRFAVNVEMARTMIDAWHDYVERNGVVPFEPPGEEEILEAADEILNTPR